MTAPHRPWMVPVPVKQSDFVPLFPEHNDLSVETDLAAIGAFGAVRAVPDPRRLLMCDLQVFPDASECGRLGAGRSGVYLGKYIKGVGRTVLACNWAEPDDIARNTGFLEMSRAARELLVSTYLKAKGAESIINPCLGVLIRPWDKTLRDHMVEYFSKAKASGDESQFRADTELQAISVKGAEFSRFSNLVWLSNRLDFYRGGEPGITTFTQFVRTFIAVVQPDADLAQATTETLPRAFITAIDNGIETLRKSWLLGVSWRSLHNNFAADGRFIDLEVPHVLGTPLFGTYLRTTSERLSLPSLEATHGMFELFQYMIQARMLAWYFRGRFRIISECGHPVLAEEREFAGAIADHFDLALAEHPLFSDKKMIAMLLGWASEALDPSPAQLAKLRKVITSAYRAQVVDIRNAGHIDIRPFPVRLARSGLFGSATPHTFDFVDQQPITDEAQLVNDLLIELDSIGDRDEMLVRLQEAVAKITRSCAPDPVVCSGV